MTINQNKSKTLESRTLAFSVAVAKKIRPYSKDQFLRPIVTQLLRSASSIGANYAEANNASSKADFRNKIFIAKKEAAEAKYWLHLLSELVPSENLAVLEQECLELLLIFQKIVSTLKLKTTQ